MTNKVSVIIPCYNAEAFIDRSIRSVWEQDYPDIELIVVDDGSTDQSKARIKAWEERFALKGDTLKYVYQDNRGPGGATDTGIKHVTGEYLTLLDADDVYLPGAIRKKAEFLDTHPDYAGVRNNGWMVKGSNRNLFITSEEEKQITDLFSALIYGTSNNWAGTYMVRTNILFQFYPDRNIYPSRFGQNLQIILPVAYKRKFGYIDEPLMEYMLQPNSHSQSADNSFEKDEKNSAGYQDIYVQMLDAIVKDSAEHMHYMEVIDYSFQRSAMLRAIHHKQTELIDRRYRLLSSSRYFSLNDRISYYSVKKPSLALFYRCIRKAIHLLRLKEQP